MLPPNSRVWLAAPEARCNGSMVVPESDLELANATSIDLMALRYLYPQSAFPLALQVCVRVGATVPAAVAIIGVEHVGSGLECSGTPGALAVRDSPGRVMRCHAGWWLVDEPIRRHGKWHNGKIETDPKYPWEM